MNIDRKLLLTCPPEAAADQLYELGKTLRGANLKKSSWLLIANGLHVQRIADILFQRLSSATTRQDALRVLRIARKFVRERKKGSGGARRQAMPENLLAVAVETSPEMYQEDEMIIRWELEMDEEIWPRENFEEWLAEQQNNDPTARTRYPGLLPLSTLQEAIARYAWDRRPLDRHRQEDLRSRLDEETYQSLLALARRETGLNLTDPEIVYLREHNLHALLAYAQHPQLPHDLIPVRDGSALAGLRFIEDHAGIKGHPVQVDWEAIAQWLAERLARKPEPAEVYPIIASAYAFFRSAPAALLARFLQGAGGWYEDWAGLRGYAYPRTAELLPEKVAPPAEEPHGWWGINGAHVTETRWERVLDAGVGSRLVFHNLKVNTADLLAKPAHMKDRHWNAVRKLLMAGGGTLRRMDYPSFTLVCRPSISLVRLETFTELVNLARKLVEMESWVTCLNRFNLAIWVGRVFEALAHGPLPEGLDTTIAETLERHAIAYLMLKERVLRESFQAAPFRLRRKHIQRFWAGQESEEALSPIPTTLEALRDEFGLEPVKEALAHALLDHFKDDWGVGEAAAPPLKEALVFMLRSVAITYHLSAPWLPHMNYQLSENDLEHTQEVASFLIQQTGHAPLQLAQALLIDPQQGLPRMAGGRLTDLERSCRRLVKEIAGVSQKKVSDGEARVFTCRPLPKSEALDRGNLGGDCSSDSVPMRALSPHHTYYGIFENGQQQRGYMTVYEAWAELVGDEAQGGHLPVLCLETINAPMRIFDAVQQDLLVIFEAIAKSRGLAEGLVLITGITTWNYHNGDMLRQSRRFRQGRPVRLFPADPASWNVYSLLAPEAQYYTAFFKDDTARHYEGYFRLLAPFQPDLDAIEPENLAESQRIAAMPPRQLRLTARGENGPAGFISELPLQ